MTQLQAYSLLRPPALPSLFPSIVTGPADPKWCRGLITVAIKKSEGEETALERERPWNEGLTAAFFIGDKNHERTNEVRPIYCFAAETEGESLA